MDERAITKVRTCVTLDAEADARLAAILERDGLSRHRSEIINLLVWYFIEKDEQEHGEA